MFTEHCSANTLELSALDKSVLMDKFGKLDELNEVNKLVAIRGSVQKKGPFSNLA